MNRICLLYPYFGKFNSYFSLFLNSAKYNSNIDFHFFTDQENCDIYSKTEYKNIFFHEDSLDNVSKRLSNALGIKCELDNPYKLCDYKPFYNLIFDVAKQYEFWGFGDVDLILGNLKAFLTDDILNEIKVIGKLGHLCIVKNDNEVTNLFLNTNKEEIERVCSSKNNTGFDEGEFSYFNTFKSLYGDCVFNIDNIIADIRPQYKKINRHKFTNKPERKTLAGVRYFVFDRGKLLAFRKNEKPFEVLYVHFQKRPMKIKTNNIDEYLIVPNLFIDYKTKSWWRINRFRLFEFIRHQVYWLKFYLKK